MDKHGALKVTVDTIAAALARETDPEKIVALTDRLLQAVNQLPEEERLWSDIDVLSYLGLTNKNTLAKMRSERRIPFIKAKGLREARYHPASIIKWAKNNEVKPHPAWRKAS